MIRALEQFDVERLKKIHDKYFVHEFSFSEFYNGFLCCFVVTDDTDDSIITAVGVRPIAEVVAITNLDKTVKLRREALYKTLEAAAHMGGQAGFDQLHCFIQDGIWENQLIKHGWRYTKGNSLVFDI